MEETKIESNESEERSKGGFKGWLQDNLRVILSVIIVIVIAGGIYSYSKRSENLINENLALIEDEQASDESIDQTADQDQQQEESDESITIEDTSAQDENADTEVVKTEETTEISTTKETGDSFVETAEKGNGATHLARKALAHYLEKNPDSELTKEHKIYIEDYLRKNVGFQNRVSIGTTIEFSKDLIRQAIESSKKLSDAQLKNLQKYSALVTSL